MIYYYIHEDEFITTDEPLNENEYEVGEQNISDYNAGKYIPLDRQQIEYMRDHPRATPLEVFFKQEFGDNYNYGRKLSPVINWYNENVEYVLINNKRYPLFDWKGLLSEALVYKEAGRETMTFLIGEDWFQGTPQEVYDFAINMGVFNCDLDRVRYKHFGYLESNLDDIGDYDYTEGAPEVISITFTKV